MTGPISMCIERDVLMEMRDGTSLRADIYRPGDAQKHPAILTRAMFKTFGVVSHMEVISVIEAGYVIVSQVCRGRGASGGDWTGKYAADVEGADGYDSVEWIAGQKWCDGNVSMMGYSHSGGFTWAAAMENPPHLKAIAPWSSGAGGGRSSGKPPMPVGVIQLMNSLNWMINEIPDVVNRMKREGQDVAGIIRAIEWAQSNPEEYIHFLPLKDMPFTRLERIGRIWNWRLNPITREEKTYEKVRVPCLHLTGWYDGIAWDAIESFKNMQELGGSQLARESQHIIVGPWAHSGWLLSQLAGMNFGGGVGGQHGQSPAHRYLLDFLDKYIKGKDIKVPRVRYFVMGKNQWQEADAWPLPESRWQRFYLHSKGKANTSAGDGLLSRDEPGSEPADRFEYNPLNPVPTVGGPIVSSLAGFGFVAGPLEQSHIERRSDVLCYTTSELKEDIQVTGGPLEIHIFAATSARDTDFTAKLVDVHPDGRSHNVADGITRVSVSLNFQPAPVNPGEVNEYVIGLGNTSQLFRKGHRIRIDISSSNFPLYDRNMNTGNPIGDDSTGVTAAQTIFHQPAYTSYIDLPVIPG